MNLRTGIGMDAHRFAADRKLVLGGVMIPHDSGLAGHSDADVLVHAVIDAMLGAAALGDIGKLFPDTDPAWKDACSMDLLVMTRKVLSDNGWLPGNTDVTVVAEQPKLAPYIEQMRGNMATALNVDISAVSIKATTVEGMGAIGRKEGIAAMSVVTIVKGDDVKAV